MDNQREKDIQELCKQVLENFVEFGGSQDSSDYCVFCKENLYTDTPILPNEHDENCAVLIAKDLSSQQ